jgi:carbonic anhydrase
LHKIEKLIVVNHEDCGAIKLAENKKDYIEKEIHQSSFQKLEKKINKNFLN